MLLLSTIREERDRLLEGLAKRKFIDAAATLDKIVALDDERKSSQTQLDQLLSEQKSLSKEIGDLFKSGKAEEANAMKAKIAELKEESSILEERFKAVKSELETELLGLPNLAHTSVPAGSTEEDNEVVKDLTGTIPDLGDDAMPHWDLSDKYGIFDLKLGVKLTGAGFPVFKGQGARLQRALINFFLDEASNAGYREYVPPLMVNEDSARGTGQLPDKEGQMYYVNEDDLYLIPTAEVPLTNIYRDVILKEDDFPIKMCGYTPCFRREAGSYGADVKGLNRVHQFDKIEIVQVQHPKKSYETLTQMCNHIEGLLQKLELPYRILRLCAGDLSFASALTFDFEVYSAAQKRWLEVSSVSNFETFQTNRLKLRYRNEEGKTTLAHTLNGSALALPRIIAALLENNQTSDGITIPDVLRKYTGFDKIK
jgi:seryl-tRNA synthetase|tara:strand:- start:6103 stop:7380 length:1278 start_codon:yes stop_codon:yes gene_type:complete